MQQQTDTFFYSAHGWAVVSARGGKYHVTRVTGTWYGALEAAAICGTKPAARYSQHHGWVDLSQHATVPEAAQAAGGLICSKCLRKAEQAAARERLAAQAAQEAEALAAQQAAYAETMAAVMAEADPETDAGQAWLAAQQEAEAEQQAEARAAALARADAALGITAEAARLTLAKTPADLPAVVEPAAPDFSTPEVRRAWLAEFPTARQQELKQQAARLQEITEALPTGEEIRQQKQAAAASAAVVAGTPALPCQCEHSSCTHDYLAVPAGKAAAMFIGPICDDCVSHMRPYLLKDEQAASITAEVRHMWEQQQAEAAEAAAAEAAADPAEPGSWTGDYWETCPNCEEGEFHYIRQGSCWTCDLPRLQRIRAAEEEAAEALQLMPNVRTWAVSAMVYLEERGYAVERTIRRNLSRDSLPVAMAALGLQENLSKLTAYPDGMG